MFSLAISREHRAGTGWIRPTDVRLENSCLNYDLVGNVAVQRSEVLNVNEFVERFIRRVLNEGMNVADRF